VSGEIAAFAASVQNPAQIEGIRRIPRVRIDPIDPLDLPV
jgi:hypothetical protein